MIRIETIDAGDLGAAIRRPHVGAADAWERVAGADGVDPALSPGGVGVGVGLGPAGSRYQAGVGEQDDEQCLPPAQTPSRSVPAPGAGLAWPRSRGPNCCCNVRKAHRHDTGTVKREPRDGRAGSAVWEVGSPIMFRLG